jgi:hypothetical protein
MSLMRCALLAARQPQTLWRTPLCKAQPTNKIDRKKERSRIPCTRDYVAMNGWLAKGCSKQAAAAPAVKQAAAAAAAVERQPGIGKSQSMAQDVGQQLRWPELLLGCG